MATIVLCGVTGAAFASESTDSRILYFEPLRLVSPTNSVQQKSSQTRELQFDAYGRRFVVTLEPNDKLTPLLQTKPGSAATSDIELYRGEVNGEAASWARISITGGKLQGMLWDGTDLYVIEPLAEIRDALPENTKVDADTTAIFRLADVMMTPGATSCGTDTTNVSKGTDAYNSMVNELKGSSRTIMQAVGATKRLEISILGDTLFTSRFGSDTQARDEILRRLNNVDGIYSSQLGVQITVPSIDFGDSVSDTTASSSLLDELGDLRKRSPSLNSRGLTHFFTGRDLDGTTVGIAYINSVCDRQFGVGLTEARNRSAWTESLITAHEIGHNFGAPHDGDPDEACASTPVGKFLMSSSINGSDTFSTCSLNIMRPKAATASCITALSAADIAVDANLGTSQQPLNNSFDWALTVRNAGGLTTAGAKAEITLPTDLTIDEAFVSGGSCTSGAGLITCELGQIAGGNSVAVQLTLHSSVAAQFPISVAVSATNEANTANNHGAGIISTQPQVDLAVALQAPTSVAAGTPFNTTISATNLSNTDADTVTLTFMLPVGMVAASAAFGGTDCSIGGGNITCSLPSLAAGKSVTGFATLMTTTVGDSILKARISSAQTDANSSNDTASATINASSVAMPAEQSSSGGGGGSTGPGLLALLLAVLGLKNLSLKKPGLKNRQRRSPAR